MKRFIVQCSTEANPHGGLVQTAVADDGTAWMRFDIAGYWCDWTQVTELPDAENKDDLPPF